MKYYEGSEIKSMQERYKLFSNGLPILAFFLMATLISGCAASRGIIDVRVATPENPQTGTSVKITRVTDSRVFELKPSKASIPSLKYGEIDNKAITTRALARRRGTYGKALGDFLMPEGRTVEMLTKEALTRSFREKGFRVLEPGDTGYEDAISIEADIYQFWSWRRYSFGALKLNFEARIHIKGDVGAFKSGQEVKSSIHLSILSGGTRAYTNILNKGIDDLVKQVKEEM